MGAPINDPEFDDVVGEYADLIALMNSPAGREAADALFSATPAEIGEGAARWHRRERND